MMKINESKTLKKKDYVDGLGPGVMYVDIYCEDENVCQCAYTFVPDAGMTRNYDWQMCPPDYDDYLRKENFEEI